MQEKKLTINNNFEEIIKSAICNYRKIGEQSGGSGHLGFVNITEFNIETVEFTTYKEQPAWEVTFRFKTFTETEFEHAPQDDIYYQSEYRDKVILDENTDVLNYIMNV